jgi:hypothetical protein
VLNHEPPNGDRQFEPARAGTARIEVKNAVAHVLLWDVAVAADDSSESRHFGIEIELGEIVENIECHSAELDHFGFSQFAGPSGFVHVSADGRDWSEIGKAVENFRVADVAGMNDMFRSAQRFKCLRTKQAVRVGDDADKNVFSQCPEESFEWRLAFIRAFISAYDGAPSSFVYVPSRLTSSARRRR